MIAFTVNIDNGTGVFCAHTDHLADGMGGFTHRTLSMKQAYKMIEQLQRCCVENEAKVLAQ